MTEILAIIPARGGSKRLPGKNIKWFMGKPLIAWTIEAALKAPSITRVIVSTDCEEIKQAVLDYGYQCGSRRIPGGTQYWNKTNIRYAGELFPFMRPDELATDSATSEDVVIHALDWLKENEGYEPDLIVLLQATSPLRTAVDVEACIQQMPNPHDGRGIVSFVGGPWNHDERNGAIYASVTKCFRDKTFGGDGWGPLMYIMPWERSIDIDTQEDFELAEFVARETWGK